MLTLGNVQLYMHIEIMIMFSVFIDSLVFYSNFPWFRIPENEGALNSAICKAGAVLMLYNARTNHIANKLRSKYRSNVIFDMSRSSS